MGNTSSVFGLFAQPGMSGYNASKFAVRGFTESLRQELDLQRCGVSATCVHPGGIRTDICRSSRIDANMTGFLIHNEQQARADFEKLFITDADRLTWCSRRTERTSLLAYGSLRVWEGKVVCLTLSYTERSRSVRLSSNL